MNCHACCVLYSYCFYPEQFCFFCVAVLCGQWRVGENRGALLLWLWLIWCLSPGTNIQLHTICRPHSGPSHSERLKRTERDVSEGGMQVVALKKVRAGGGSTSSLMPWQAREKCGNKKGRRPEVSRGRSRCEDIFEGWKSKKEVKKSDDQKKDAPLSVKRGGKGAEREISGKTFTKEESNTVQRERKLSSSRSTIILFITCWKL